ncbi:hypothetical protein DO65_4926 [Burkholderia pseudomallei]|nr:hypothetical protein DO65_4926 [Burkholderia pseudomallei]
MQHERGVRCLQPRDDHVAEPLRRDGRADRRRAEIDDDREPDAVQDHRKRERQLDPREPLQRAHAHCARRVDGAGGHVLQPRDRAFEDRQQPVQDQRDQHGLHAEADGRHREREHRDGRKGLPDMHDAARDRQEFRARAPRDENPGRERDDRARRARRADDREMRQRQIEKARAPVDRGRAVVGERREKGLEPAGPREHHGERGQRGDAREHDGRAPARGAERAGLGRGACGFDRARHAGRFACATIASSVMRLAAAPSALDTGSARAPRHNSSEIASRSVSAPDIGSPGAAPGSASASTRVSASRRSGRSSPATSRSTTPGCGRPRISAGEPACRMRPASITAIWSPSRSASSMSCVTITTVIPSRRCSATRSSCALPRMIGSSAPNGSSISRIAGSAASARATPTRCCWPPDN